MVAPKLKGYILEHTGLGGLHLYCPNQMEMRSGCVPVFRYDLKVKNDSASAAMQARSFFISLHNHPQDKPVVFYGELAVAAQLFGNIQNALDTVAMAFPEGCWDAIAEKGRFPEGVFHAQKGLSVAVLQKQPDVAFVLSVLSVQCVIQSIGQDGGENTADLCTAKSDFRQSPYPAAGRSLL